MNQKNFNMFSLASMEALTISTTVTNNLLPNPSYSSKSRQKYLLLFLVKSIMSKVPLYQNKNNKSFLPNIRIWLYSVLQLMQLFNKNCCKEVAIFGVPLLWLCATAVTHIVIITIMIIMIIRIIIIIIKRIKDNIMFEKDQRNFYNKI